MIHRDMTIREILAELPEAEDMPLRELCRLASSWNGSGLSDSMTLPEFYEKCYRPEVSDAKDLDKNTYQQREQALALWEKINGGLALCDIDKASLSRFVVEVRKEISRRTGLPIAPATVRKHCAAIQSVLDYAGPRSDRTIDSRDAKGLIPVPPLFPPVRVLLNPTDHTPTREEVHAIVKATECAVYPKLPDISAADWWRNAYKVLELTGMRKGDLLGVKWEHIRKFDGFTAFVIPAEVEKTGVEKIVPISSAVRAILEEMPRKTESGHIFEWPHSRSVFTRQRMQIVAKSGITKAIRGTWHAMRRFVATVVRDASLVLGHTTSTVTTRHYQSMARAFEALEELGKGLNYGES